MQTNPLILPVLDFLKSSGSSVTLLGIIAFLEEDQLFQSLSGLSGELQAFRKNFLVMNALYHLQQDLLDTGYFLSISPMCITLDSISAKSDKKTLTGYVDQKLSSYYLDWMHYHDTVQEDVESLLNRFWDRYYAQDKRQAALNVLGVAGSANRDDVKKAYRRLVNQCHPDKGGDHKQFIEIREAYEILTYCLDR